jgi:hypothetical protein
LITWVLRYSLNILKEIITITDSSSNPRVVYTLIDDPIVQVIDRVTASTFSRVRLDATDEDRRAAVCLFWTTFLKELLPVIATKMETASENKKLLLRAFNQNVLDMSRRKPAQHSFPFPPFSFTLLHYLDDLWNDEDVFFEHVRQFFS